MVIVSTVLCSGCSSGLHIYLSVLAYWTLARRAHVVALSVPSCGLVAAPVGALWPSCCGSSATSPLFRSCLLLGQGCGWPAGAFVVVLEGPVNSLVGHGLFFFYHVELPCTWLVCMGHLCSQVPWHMQEIQFAAGHLDESRDDLFFSLVPFCSDCSFTVTHLQRTLAPQP